MELAQGDHGRSGGQYDIWQAVFSPVGTDGYPKPIFDKLTGVIDKEVAAYWRDHFDLSHIIQRDWATLGPKLRGKIHIYVGTGRHLLSDQRRLLRPGAPGKPEARRTGERWPTAIAPSTAGTAIRSWPTPIRACTTTSSTCQQILERIAATAPGRRI